MPKGGRDDERRPTAPAAAWGLLALVLAAFFAPILFRGHVLHAHDNRLEVGLPEEPDSPYRSSRFFQDQTTMFVPELHEHRHGARDGWISTWFPHSGLGRPTWHHFGVGKAFAVDHVLSWLVDDPYVAYSWLLVLALTAAAVFTLLFLRSQGLDPLAALAGALALSVGTFHLGWPTFPMLNWGFAGTFAALWLVERLLIRPTALGWVGLVAALHVLLLAAYPQQVAFHAWIAGAFVLLRVLTAPETEGRRAATLSKLAGAAALAVASVAPVYADVLLDLSRSIRAGLGPEYVAAGLPRLESWTDVRVFLVQAVDTFWIGDPLAEDYPRALSVMPAHTLTPAVAGLVVLGVARGWRAGGRAPLWAATVLAALVLTACAPLYRFAAEHLWLSFSRLSPFVAALPGLAVLAAVGVDRAIARGGRRWADAALVLVPFGVALAAAAPDGVPPDRGAVALGAATALIAAVGVGTRSRVVLLAVLLAIPFTYGTRMALHRPRADVATTSPLVERVREHLEEGGGRFAWVGARPEALLASNQEAVLGLRSIHTHDAFASRDFARWAEALCPVAPMTAPPDAEDGPATYDRRFPRVGHESRLTDEVLATAGLSLLLSSRPLAPRIAEPLEVVGGVHLSRPHVVGPGEALTAAFERADAGEVRVTPAALLAGDARAAVTRAESMADRLTFSVQPADAARLLFVSQAFHPAWRARTGGDELETVRVNDLFQGVFVPAGADGVTLIFRPWVRFAWIPQVLLALAFALALVPGAGLAARSRRRDR